MRIPKTVLALGVVGALVGVGVGVDTHAQAATTISGTTATYARDSEDDVLRAAVLNATDFGNELEFTWDAPLSMAGVFDSRVQTRMWIGGKPQYQDGATVNRVGNTVTMVSTDATTGITVTRTIELHGDTVVVTQSATNTTSSAKWVRADMRHRSFSAGTEFVGEYDNGTITARSAAPGYDIAFSPNEGHVSSGFSDSFGEAIPGSGVGVQGAAGGADIQGARWAREVAPGETFEAQVRVRVTPQPISMDHDGDGIPDEWERGSFTPDGGEALHLHKWGAGPDKKDVFLQLNWMVPEFTNQDACKVEGRFAVNVQGLTDWAECAAANKNAYRPSKKILDDLVKEFDRGGVRLHIDAGEWYHTYHADTYKGGEIPFAKYPFENKVSSHVFNAFTNDLLGSRDAVFRLGVIGDQMAPGIGASGRGQMPGSAFYVAWYKDISSDEQVRNTMLHEFGHNLGLDHSGSIKFNDRPRGYDYIPGYRSTMNYLYQFSHFGLTSTWSTSGSWPVYCETAPAGQQCAPGEFRIAPDWENLTLTGGRLGRAIGQVTPEIPQKTEDEVRGLIKIAADSQNGTGGFRLVDTPEKPNGVLTASRNNVVHAEISNYGTDTHEFTLEARYLNQTWVQKVTVAGLSASEGKLLIDVPVNPNPTHSQPTLPVEFTLFNQDGEVQYNQTLSIPVLDYTKDEIARVVAELPSDATGPVRAVVEGKLKPALTEVAPEPSDADADADAGGPASGGPGAGGPAVPAPLPTRPPAAPGPGPGADSGPGAGPGSGPSAAPLTSIPAVPRVTTVQPTHADGVTVTPAASSAGTATEPLTKPLTVVSIILGVLMTLGGAALAAGSWLATHVMVGAMEGFL